MLDICVHVCHVYVCICVCVYVCMGVYVYVCVYICMYVCVCMCVSVCGCVWMRENQFTVRIIQIVSSTPEV